VLLGILVFVYFEDGSRGVGDRHLGGCWWVVVIRGVKGVGLRVVLPCRGGVVQWWCSGGCGWNGGNCRFLMKRPYKHGDGFSV